MDALPLPARPSVAHYRQRAEELRQARDDGRVREWALGWLEELAPLLGNPVHPAVIQRAADHLARQVNAMASLPRTAAGAEDVIAALHAFDGWEAFARHLEELSVATSQTARFEAAADAVVGGDLATLTGLLRDDPTLVGACSNRRSRATLLHYVAANGVEDFRQKTPASIVEVTRLLLAAGAEVDARNADYGGGGTALGLVATSIHPQEAGVQLTLMDVLASAGASLEGLPGGWRPMDAAVANGCPEAAAWLIDRGAPVTLIAAAALGRVDDVARTVQGAAPDEIEQALRMALRAVPYARPPDPADYLTVIDMLIAAGARVDPAWRTGVAAIDERLRRAAGPT